MLLLADDYGCFESTPAVIRGKCYPLQESIRKTDVEKWQLELRDKSIIRSWVDNGHEYSMFVTFDKHNDLAEQHAPTTPCPPWLLDEKGFDPRLSTKTLQAYELISVAVDQLSSNGKKPTYRKIQEITKCSMTTISKYLKQALITEHNESATDCYTSLQIATDATPKNHNPNPNHNHNTKKEIEKKKVPVPLVKNPYGEFQNIFLTDEQYQSLIKRFGEKEAKERIETASESFSSHKDYPKKYTNHYATILSWARLDKKRADINKPSFTVRKYEDVTNA